MHQPTYHTLSVLLLTMAVFCAPSSLKAQIDNTAELAATKAEYEAILADSPDSLETILQLAVIEEQLGNETAMLRRVDEAIVSHPQAWQPRLIKGRHFLKNDDLEGANEVLSPLDGPQLSELQVIDALATTRIRLGKYEESVNLLERLAWIAPNNAEVFYRLARSYGEVNNAPLSELALERTLSLNSSHYSARVTLARLELLKGQVTQARMHYEVLLQNHGESADVIKLGEAISAAER